MMGMVIVFGRMLVGRAIAAAHVTTLQAEPEMDPPVTALEAFLASLGGARLHLVNVIEM